jgi:hypothetical protein
MTIYFVSAQDMHGALREAPSADWHPTRADAQKLAQRLANSTRETHLVYSVEEQDYFEPEVPVEPDLDLTGYKLWNPPPHSTALPRGIGPKDYVSVILRDGNVLSPELASHYNWDVNYAAQALGTYDESDIIAYRVVEDWERAKDDYVPFFGDLKGTLPKGVGPRTLVLLRFRSQTDTSLPTPAKGWNWSINPQQPTDGDIVAYLIVDPQDLLED